MAISYSYRSNYDDYQKDTRLEILMRLREENLRLTQRTYSQNSMAMFRQDLEDITLVDRENKSKVEEKSKKLKNLIAYYYHRK